MNSYWLDKFDDGTKIKDALKDAIKKDIQSVLDKIQEIFLPQYNYDMSRSDYSFEEQNIQSNMNYLDRQINQIPDRIEYGLWNRNRVIQKHVYNQLTEIEDFIDYQIKKIQYKYCYNNRDRDPCGIENKISEFKFNESLITDLVYNDDEYRKKVFIDFIESLKLKLTVARVHINENLLNDINIFLNIYEQEKQKLIEWLEWKKERLDTEITEKLIPIVKDRLDSQDKYLSKEFDIITKKSPKYLTKDEVDLREFIKEFEEAIFEEATSVSDNPKYWTKAEELLRKLIKELEEEESVTRWKKSLLGLLCKKMLD